MDADAIKSRLLKRPRIWHTVGGFEFLIERLNQNDLYRINQECTELVSVGDKTERRLDGIKRLESLLGAVKGWRGVRYGDVSGWHDLTADEAAAPAPFDVDLARVFFGERQDIAAQIITWITDAAFRRAMEMADEKKP